MRLNLIALTVLSALATAFFEPSARAQFTPTDIGNPALTGSTAPSGNGYNVSGAGTDIYGIGDQFHFNSAEYTGDFDVKLRVQSYSALSVWAKAGLMARETFATNSRHASVFATPSLSGTFFAARTTAGGVTTNIGSFPVGYPNTWLRLKRAAATFTGYASVDGQTWAQLGTVTLVSPSNTVNVGMAVTSATSNQLATAQFRDFTNVVGGIIGNVELAFEPPGPCSRNTGLVISEIMYHPKRTNDLEFIEIFNAGLIEENLGGYRISGDVDYTFAGGTTLRAGGRLVVARYPANVETAYGISGVLGPWTGNGATAPTNALPDDSGTLRLRNKSGAVLLEVTYAGDNPWPIAADGAGHSLVLSRPSYGEGDYRAWSASDQIGGSPGAADPVSADPMRAVVINEFLANTDEPLLDYVELYNHGNQPVDISGAYLSDDRDTNRFRIPNGTVLDPRGFVSYTESANELGFSLSSGGERIYLVNSNQTRVIDVVVFEAQATGVSSGRYPNGAPGFQELIARTQGTSNSPPLIRSVVINEIMYNPISGNDEDEYVELYNKGPGPVDVSGWRFTDGIDFRIPASTVIASNGYLVIAKSKANLLANYAQLNAANTLGDFSGELANGGERLALAMPDYFLATNNTVVSTQANYIVMDEVTYDDSGRWSRWADGGGSSLELIDPNSNHRLAANWADSDESAKSAWTNITTTGLLDNIYPVNATGATADEIQVMILGGGEALMDDLVAQTGTSGPNLVLNPNFDNGLTSWTIQGNHVRSTLEPVGPGNPSQCLHIRASAGGDNGANKVECNLSAALANNSTATLGGRFRWLQGFPIILVRVHGGALEAVGTLPLPKNLGTPGQVNSRRAVNAGPAIYDVTHAPILPSPGEPVVVTARVNDPDGVASVQLRYRLDPSASVSTLPMRDDGTGGDSVAGDGLYAATIPGQGAGTNAFRVTATDAHATSPATALFPNEALGECVFRWGEPSISGNLGVYRIWMTTSNINLWGTRERLSNQAIDGTVVYGNFRVIYNAGARYRGSAFTRNPASPNGVGVAANYVWTLPDDDHLLGTDELNLDCLEPGGSSNVRDVTALREVTSFTMLEQLGLPFSYQRYVHVVINGVTSASRNIPIYTDSQQPNGEYTTMWFPDDDDGDLFKIDDWFEFADTLVGTDGTGMQGNKSASLENFTTPSPTGPVKKQARYRWSWEKKFNRGLNDDYSHLFEAVDALNSPEASYLQQVQNEFEIREWLAALAFRHVVGDWDGYGYQRGKNQFCYRPRGGKFWMLMWDLDFSLGCNSGHAPGQDLFTVSLGGAAGSDNMPEVNRLYTNPSTRRIYLQALQQLAEGPMQDANFLPSLDARYRALLANGVSGITSPFVASGAQSISVPAWIQQRRGFITTNTANGNRISLYTNAPFRITSSLNVTNTTDNRLTITGTGSLPIRDIILNGVAWPVTWTSVTGWTARVVLAPGSNIFSFAGLGLTGNAITSTQTVVAQYTGPVVLPQDAIVFNEIMHNPNVPEASFVELFNRSSFSFDIGGWRVNGLDYTFPAGSIITNGQFLVLMKNRSAFMSAFGTNALVYDVFEGEIDPDGETLTLLIPSGPGYAEVVVDKIRYENRLPWPPNAAFGTSLQLIDSSIDNSRPSDWAAGASWVNVTRTANIVNATNLLVWLPFPGPANCFIDDITLTATNEGGTNIVLNGDFESELSGPWILPAIYSGSYITNGIAHSGNRSLYINGTSAGSGLNVIQQWIGPRVPTNAVCTLSYWILVNTNVVTVRVRTLPGSAIDTTGIADSILATPGVNNLFAGSLTPYDALWLNELQVSNVAGITDNFGDRDPWVEIYNGSANPLTLDGYFLSENYSGNLQQWPFPNGVTVGAHQFKIVWLDGEPQETVGIADLHANFRLRETTGTVALVRSLAGVAQITDYLTYSGLGTGLSYGDYPDGQPFVRRIFQSVTPSGTNISRGVNVFINEWMAGNTTNSMFFDPADGDYNDWFELYNAGEESVNLSGYYLTDNLGSATKYQVPTNSHYIIPPGGFLLVWADAEAEQNNADRPDLHVSFRLSGFLGSIGLFAPDGVSQIDAITYGQQTDDVSEGRCADGAIPPFVFFHPGQQGPSPRAANSCAFNNVAPTLAAIGDRTVRVEQTLSFTALATDLDTPPQTLSFSLANQPVGATIGALSGLFTWTPTAAQAFTTNHVTISVTDNGTPPRADSEIITIVALPKPKATIINNAGSLSISFDTIPGRAYRVEFKTNLNDATWQHLTENTTANSTTMTVPDTIGAERQRFYRIVETN